MGLLHTYHLSVLPLKQHKIPLICSCQIRMANVSRNLTDAHIKLYHKLQQHHPHNRRKAAVLCNKNT